MIDPTLTIAEIQISPSQLELWKSGALPSQWAKHHPFLFDDLDLALTRTQLSVHYVEWLGAIILHHTTGFHALVEKYEFKKAHHRKQEVVEKLFSGDLLALVRDMKKGAQCPDLLMYAPDCSDWFFCEVKGPTDRLRPVQLGLFSRLATLSGKPVRLLKFTHNRS